jgi:L-asparaginase II
VSDDSIAARVYRGSSIEALHAASVAVVNEHGELTHSSLLCGTHLPIELRLRHEAATHGEDRDPLRHNCSGKHAGFLVCARRLGEPLAAYLEPKSSVQLLVHEAVASVLEVPSPSLATAIDGCSAPTFATPLVALARGMKNLALASAAESEHAEALRRVRDAMLTEPYFVSGDGRFDYDLARSFPNDAVVKGGAEAILGIGFRNPPLGVAIKVHDGAERALAPIAVAVLRELALVDDLARFPFLARYERPAITNARRLRTGELVAEVRLRRERQ